MAPAEPELARAREELHRLHARWLCLTHEESAAISAANWVLVIQHQTAKKHLQKETTAATQHLREAAELCAAGQSQLQSEFLPEVEELIRLESRNRELMTVQLHQARVQFQKTNQVAFNLTQLRHAYAGGQNSIWQSYS